MIHLTPLSGPVGSVADSFLYSAYKSPHHFQPGRFIQVYNQNIVGSSLILIHRIPAEKFSDDKYGQKGQEDWCIKGQPVGHALGSTK